MAPRAKGPRRFKKNILDRMSIGKPEHGSIRLINWVVYTMSPYFSRTVFTKHGVFKILEKKTSMKHVLQQLKFRYGKPVMTTQN